MMEALLDVQNVIYLESGDFLQDFVHIECFYSLLLSLSCILYRYTVTVYNLLLYKT